MAHLALLKLALALAFSSSASAAFNVSNLVSSDAVLQRGKPNTVWGYTNDTAAVIAATWVDDVVYSSAPASGGVWRVTFPAAPASSAPFDLAFTSSAGGAPATLERLLVGDVFLCAGQSNMGAVQVSAMWNVSEILAHAVALQPVLRIMQVSGNLQSPVPLDAWPTSGLVPWQPPLGVDGNTTGPLLGFSAVCFIMGSTLADEHLAGRVPVGLIHSSHGGTSIQAWASPEGAAQCGDNSNSWNTSVLYNSISTRSPSARRRLRAFTGTRASRSVFSFSLSLSLSLFLAPFLPPLRHSPCFARAPPQPLTGRGHWLV